MGASRRHFIEAWVAHIGGRRKGDATTQLIRLAQTLGSHPQSGGSMTVSCDGPRAAERATDKVSGLSRLAGPPILSLRAAACARRVVVCGRRFFDNLTCERSRRLSCRGHLTGPGVTRFGGA